MSNKQVPLANESLRITLFCTSLHSGGAERVMSILAQQLANRGHKITLLTIHPKETDFFPVPDSVDRKQVNIGDKPFVRLSDVYGQYRRLRAIRQSIVHTQPDVVLSFVDKLNIMTLLGTIRTGIPVVVSERSAPDFTPLRSGWKLLRRLSYPWAKCVVTQTQAARAYFLPKLEDTSIVIPNPVPVPNMTASPRGQDDNVKTLISLGRLSAEKCFDRLIRAFANVAPQFPDWRLDIYGDGPQRGELTALCNSLTAGNRIRLLGSTQEPIQKLAEAHLFAMTSAFEGYPNALCEALSCGLPSISIDCPHGPREIIRQGIDGILVPPDDDDALEQSLRELMSNPDSRERMGIQARSICDRLGVGTVVDAWESALRLAATGSPVPQGTLT
jgi:glycosyltransferase involved in cell wall biosynthesis